MVFVPRRSHTPDTVVWCRWCTKFKPKKATFKIRDGPIDWYFCDVQHAELWLTHRHRRTTYHLCRMLPADRLCHLQGRSMEQEISRIEAADALAVGRICTDSVRAVHNSEVPVQQDA